MSPVHDREDQAFRSAYAVMVEDTPDPPEWEELRPATRLIPEPEAPRGLVIALAAAFVVLVLVGGITLVLHQFGSDNPVIGQVPPPTSLPVTTLPKASPTTIPSPTTTPNTTPPTSLPDIEEPTESVPTTVLEETGWGEEDGVAVLAGIDNFYLALNSGDVEAALALFDLHGSNLSLPMAIDGLHSQFAYNCTLVETGRSVECIETVTDGLYGPAGITQQATIHYGLREDGLLVGDFGERSSVCQLGDPTGYAMSFLIDFRVWAAEVHPELERHWKWGEPIDSALAVPCTQYPFWNPEGAIEISKVVPEFVAESDRWPIDGT